MLKEFNYTITKEDLELYEKEYILALKEERKNIKFSLSFTKKQLLVFVIILLYSLLKGLLAFGILKTIVIVFIAIIIFIFLKYLAHIFHKNVIGIKFIFKPQMDYNYTINSDTGIIKGNVLCNNKVHNFEYANIYNIYLTNNFLAFIIKPEHSAIIIPRKIFKDNNELETTYNILTQVKKV